MLNIALPGVVIIYEELIEKADRIISSTENFLKKIEAYDKLKALKIEVSFRREGFDSLPTDSRREEECNAFKLFLEEKEKEIGEQEKKIKQLVNL
jgi:hypothetical protein